MREKEIERHGTAERKKEGERAREEREREKTTEVGGWKEGLRERERERER